MKTLGTVTLKENDEIETEFDKALGFSSIQLARRLLEEALLPKMFGRHSRISWKGKNLVPRFIYLPFSAQPS
jgi:hypothetical protein